MFESTNAGFHMRVKLKVSNPIKENNEEDVLLEFTLAHSVDY